MLLSTLDRLPRDILFKISMYLIPCHTCTPDYINISSYPLNGCSTSLVTMVVSSKSGIFGSICSSGKNACILISEDSLVKYRGERIDVYTD